MKKVMEIMFGPSPADESEKAFSVEALTVEAVRAIPAGQPRATRFTRF